jgi:hypothetical protein
MLDAGIVVIGREEKIFVINSTSEITRLLNPSSRRRNWSGMVFER